MLIKKAQPLSINVNVLQLDIQCMIKTQAKMSMFINWATSLT